jgi:hypothetical protein
MEHTPSISRISDASIGRSKKYPEKIFKNSGEKLLGETILVILGDSW